MRGRKAKLGGNARAAMLPPLPSPPPRPRISGGMGPPVQNPLMRATAAGKMPEMAEARSDTAPIGPALARAVGASPGRRALARGMRGGKVAF